MHSSHNPNVKPPSIYNFDCSLYTIDKHFLSNITKYSASAYLKDALSKEESISPGKPGNCLKSFITYRGYN